MNSTSTQTNLKRYLPAVALITLGVAILPLAAVNLVEGILGTPTGFWTVLLGIVFSLLLCVTGSSLWRKFGTTDILFSDLLLWGYVRRVLVERRLSQMTRRLDLDRLGEAAERMSPVERAELLSDLAATLESADPYTHGHSRRVTRHSYMIAKTMGLPKYLVDRIRVAAAVHDVGKIYTPKEVLHKPDRLNDEEYDVIKEHPVRGAEMVAILEDPEIVAMVRHHHERLDGKGYPDGLSGERIPIGARIIAVADTFDAITSTRPYRNASRHIRAIDILKRESGTQLDEAAVHAFLRYYSGRSSLGWWATLTTLPQRGIALVVNWAQQTAVGAAVQTAAMIGAGVALVGNVPGLTPFPISEAQATSTFEATESSKPASTSSRTRNDDIFDVSPNNSGSFDPEPETSSPTEEAEPLPSPTPEPEPNPSPSPDESTTPDPSPSPTPSPQSPNPSPSPSPSPSDDPGLIEFLVEVVDQLI